ncbi:CPCC family cysteine-rich protein [Flectobacillus roseus]|uniref:CPCC family cysteine-rich protein n=1 Tax=Flectobacillus roseus TaxID=502259 RepID=A0ABT6Y741_9BACT|nr:CPCC family cysteine-rich protein [Flectobacillus roseus]MDI9859380.1 CPCC family cysteine-rich protein [Flectobacillus roseus]
MIILLDIDGVLETTPAWRQVEMHSDGFMKLNERTLENLSILHKRTNASIVLTTTHRINYDIARWKEIFRLRGLNFEVISKLNSKTDISQFLDRGTEIKEWVEQYGEKQNYVIIDDDQSINALPENIKERWVATRPLIGFDKEALEKALNILISNSKSTCICCGHKTLTEKPTGTFEICPVCFWEDDPIQRYDPDYEGGANPISLKQAQSNFIDFEACDLDMKKYVRPANSDEPKDKNWKVNK